uniref:Uncharacterized protein n=1 Tax=Anguilla anguilla TaxID=7936 RepID=A0A0E9PE41_ANGAN
MASANLSFPRGPHKRQLEKERIFPNLALIATLTLTLILIITLIQGLGVVSSMSF